MSTIYVVTVNGKPIYANSVEAEAKIEAELQGGIVTPVYLYSKLVYRCEWCGVFMSEHQRYVSECRKCGTDNRP